MKKFKGKYNNFYGNFRIGEDTKIGSLCDIAGIIGKNCKVQSYVFIPSGITIEDGCFIGPGVIFTNDKYPPSNGKHWAETFVKRGARIGAGVIVLPGITIGENSLIGAGAVITCDIPPNEVWVGNPAKFLRKL